MPCSLGTNAIPLQFQSILVGSVLILVEPFRSGPEHRHQMKAQQCAEPKQAIESKKKCARMTIVKWKRIFIRSPSIYVCSTWLEVKHMFLTGKLA